jgi:aminomethyltransferase
MDLSTNPFEVSGLERLVEEQPQDYIGKAALEEIRRKGVSRKLVGVELEGVGELRAELSKFWPVLKDGQEVGRVTDAVWSPKLEKNIGYAWVPIELAEPGTKVDIESEAGSLVATTAALPFVDPRKEVPAASLQ